jgi:mycothiol synthase
MDPPAGYRLRSPRPDELGAVADVLVADELDDGGEIVLGEDFLRGAWIRSDFDLAADAWVAVDDAGTIVGYAQARQDAPTLVESWGVVHPSCRGRGIGSSLLDEVEERANRMLDGNPAGRFRHSINAGDRAAAAMLQARGLRPVRHFWHMQIDLAEPGEPGPTPEGIQITAIDPAGDLPAVHSILVDAFVDDWGHHPEPFDRWVEEEATGPRFDPTLWLLAKEGEEPVGALTASLWGDRGWVDYLAVLASHRGRGVGAALLQHSFSMLARPGVQRVLVNVDAENPTGATALYERVGMRIVKRWDLWERPAAGTP